MIRARAIFALLVAMSPCQSVLADTLFTTGRQRARLDAIHESGQAATDEDTPLHRTIRHGADGHRDITISQPGRDSRCTTTGTHHIECR